MKKPLLATLGLAGACAACCAIPVVVPLVSGLSVAGLLGSDGGQLSAGRELLAIGLGTVVALVAGWGLWAGRRRSAAACSLPMNTADSPTPTPACGCGSAAKAACAGNPG